MWRIKILDDGIMLEMRKREQCGLVIFYFQPVTM